MEHKLTVTLPDEIYQPLVKAAAQQGRTPEEFAPNDSPAPSRPSVRRSIQQQHKRRTCD